MIYDLCVQWDNKQTIEWANEREKRAQQIETKPICIVAAMYCAFNTHWKRNKLFVILVMEAAYIEWPPIGQKRVLSPTHAILLSRLVFLLLSPHFFWLNSRGSMRFLGKSFSWWSMESRV